MPNYLTVFVCIILTLVVLKFTFLLYRKNSTSYQQWAQDQRRLQLRDTVQYVRKEMGDYDTPRKSRVSARKPAATSSRPRRNTR